MKRQWMLKVVRMALLAAVFVSLVAAGVMLLWNALIPVIFGAAPITWLQALGLLALVRILVGGRGHGGFRRGGWRRRWEAKIANMSPEEREKWEAEAGRYCRSGNRGVNEGPTEA